jgi:hypothetical protein
MRRFVLSLGIVGAVALTACSGGGTVLNFNSGGTSSDRVIVTVVGPTNIARVLPGASIALSAFATNGSQNGAVGTNRFKWSAAVTTGQQYIANALGQTKPCANLIYTPAGGTGVTFLPDLNVPPYSTIAIDPTNEANILFIPPPTLSLPAGAPVGSTVTPAFPYCAVVSATSLDSGAVGSIIVAVVNPQAPLQ